MQNIPMLVLYGIGLKAMSTENNSTAYARVMLETIEENSKFKKCQRNYVFVAATFVTLRA